MNGYGVYNFFPVRSGHSGKKVKLHPIGEEKRTRRYQGGVATSGYTIGRERLGEYQRMDGSKPKYPKPPGQI
jgi:hypothetical protein